MTIPDDPPYSDDSDPLLDEPPMASSREERAGFVSEVVRKVAVAGMGALFMGEEGIRSLAGQLKLPKELLGLIVSQAEKTKDDVGRVVSEEVRRFLQSEKLRHEFVKLLSGMTVEIKAEVRLVPKKRKKGAAAPEEEPGEPLDEETGQLDDADEEVDAEEDPSEPRLRVNEITARRGRRQKKE